MALQQRVNLGVTRGYATPSMDAPAARSAETESGARRAVQYESTHAFTASISGVLFCASRAFTVAPRSIRSLTVSWLARQAATCSAVLRSARPQ